MTTLSKHINSLLTALQPVGGMEGEQSLPMDGFQLPGLGGLRLQTIELTIPCMVERAGIAAGDSKSKLGPGFVEETVEALFQLLGVEQPTMDAHDRLAKAVAEDSIKVGLLLAKDEVDENRVLLDYAQRVLALAFDAFRLKGSGPKQEKVWVSSNEHKTFEQLTEQLAFRLKTQLVQAQGPGTVSGSQVNVESEKLGKMPAHALTYIRLLISADGCTLTERTTDGS